MMRNHLCGACLVAILLSGATTSFAASPPATPDWPCVQRLVPQMTMGAFWPGPAPPANRNWRDDHDLSALVAAVTGRDVSADDGAQLLVAYAERVPPADRAQRLPETFAAILDQTNTDRSAIIARIEALTRRQRALADIVAQVTEELSAATKDPAADAADRKAEINQRREFLIRNIQETQRTMRYACDVPVQLEARLGRYARALQAGL
jgi:hypothetical protein